MRQSFEIDYEERFLFVADLIEHDLTAGNKAAEVPSPLQLRIVPRFYATNSFLDGKGFFFQVCLTLVNSWRCLLPSLKRYSTLVSPA